MENYNLNELLAKDASTLSIDELTFITNFAANLRAVNKVAKEKGVVKAKVVSVQSPEIALLADAFRVIIDNNLDIIKTLFSGESAGNKGKNITIAGSRYNVQLLNVAAFEAEREAKKAEKAKAKPEVSTEQIAAAEAAKAGTI